MLKQQPLTTEAIKKYLMEIFENMPKKSRVQISKLYIDIEFPTIEEVTKSEWFKTRPKEIQQVILEYPPTQYYALNEKQCYIHSYSEGDPITVTIYKTGRSLTPQLLPQTNGVFGVDPKDLTSWDDYFIPESDL